MKFKSALIVVVCCFSVGALAQEAPPAAPVPGLDTKAQIYRQLLQNANDQLAATGAQFEVETSKDQATIADLKKQIDDLKKAAEPAPQKQ